MTGRWIDETIYPHSRVALEADVVLHDARTGGRHLLIFKNAAWGTVLMLDGVCRLTTADAFIQHEMLAHVPLMAHGKPRRVLILGGGDGGVLRECLKHPSVAKAILFEPDRAVIDAALTHFPDLPGSAFHDSRTQIVTGDVHEYLKDSSDKFDVIIVDGLAPVATSNSAEVRALFAACRHALDDDGVLVTRSGPASPELAPLKETATILASLFKGVGAYVCALPSSFGGPLAFVVASDDEDLLELDADDLAKRQSKRGVAPLRYWTPEVDVAAFALPPYAHEVMEEAVAAAYARAEEERAAAKAARSEAKEHEEQERDAAKAAKKAAKDLEHQERAAEKAARKEAKVLEEQAKVAAKAANKKGKAGKSGKDAIDHDD
jgi:spermidine synthase